MSEEHSETLSDHLQRIHKLEEEARAKHDSEMYLEENREHLRNRVRSLEETIRRLQQEIDMIKFRERRR